MYNKVDDSISIVSELVSDNESVLSDFKDFNSKSVEFLVYNLQHQGEQLVREEVRQRRPEQEGNIKKVRTY